MKNKILYGVCGIGNGHTNRQKPIIEHLSKKNEIVILGYGASYDYFSRYYRDNKLVNVVPVAVPFYVGNNQGLDFAESAKRQENHQDFTTINCEAMANVAKILGKPDLVVSDYEPVSAQYAYAMNSQLVTIDQQSKYLNGEFPVELNQQSFKDEIQRLCMFFPHADARIACTFFRTELAKSPIAKQI